MAETSETQGEYTEIERELYLERGESEVIEIKKRVRENERGGKR